MPLSGVRYPRVTNPFATPETGGRKPETRLRPTFAKSVPLLSDRNVPVVKDHKIFLGDETDIPCVRTVTLHLITGREGLRKISPKIFQRILPVSLGSIRVHGICGSSTLTSDLALVFFWPGAHRAVDFRKRCVRLLGTREYLGRPSLPSVYVSIRRLVSSDWSPVSGVRLACLIHAATVHPELGSNS